MLSIDVNIYSLLYFFSKMDYVHEREEETNLKASYTAPRRGGKPVEQEGYVVKGAPWEPPHASAPQPKEYVADAVSDFPTLTAIVAGGQHGTAWGPWGSH